MENNVYIYGLKCPEKDIIRYVGKSKKPKSRYSSHLSHAKAKRYDNIHLYRWISKLLRNDLKPELVILDTCSNENWKCREKEWISKIGLENLLNMNEGGIAPPDCTGRVWSEEYKKKMSKQRKGKPQWVDKPHPMRKRALENNGMKGKKQPKERIEQMIKINSKPIALIDDNGDIIKKYKSQKEATVELSLTKGTVTRVCKGEYKQTKGYKFRYL
jgi:group I intron endonuclease